MDRDISSGNRVIANYMQEKQKKRLQERIKYIKTNKSIYSSNGFVREKPRVNSVFFESISFIYARKYVNRTTKCIHFQQNCLNNKKVTKSKRRNSLKRSILKKISINFIFMAQKDSIFSVRVKQTYLFFYLVI